MASHLSENAHKPGAGGFCCGGGFSAGIPFVLRSVGGLAAFVTCPLLQIIIIHIWASPLRGRCQPYSNMLSANWAPRIIYWRK